MIGLLVLALLGVLVALVCLSRPAWGVGLGAGVDLVVMEGIPVANTTVAVESFFFLYLALVPFVVQLVSGRSITTSLKSQVPLALFLGAFSVACLLSSLNAGLDRDATRTLNRLPLWAIFAMVPAVLLRTERDIQLVAKLVLGTSLLLLVWGLAAGFPDEKDQGGAFRIGYLNPFGHSLAMGSILAFGLAVAYRDPMRMMLQALAVVLLLGTLLTHSRGALAAGCAGLLAAWWVAASNRQRRGAQLLALGACPLVLAAFAMGIVGELWHDIVNTEHSSNLYRYQIAVLSLRLFLAHPILGVGIGNLEAASFGHSGGLKAIAASIIGSDNDYARILAELGALGSCVVLAWVWCSYRRVRSRLREERSPFRRASSARVIGVGLGVFLLVLGLFESVLFSATGWFYVGFVWTCMGDRRCAS